MFRIDNQSFPMVLNMTDDICLGKVMNVQSLVTQNYTNSSGQPIWQCVLRSYEVTSDGFMKFKVNQLGIYAVIVNPNPDTALATAQDCGFLC